MKYDESFVNSFNDSNNCFHFQTFWKLGRLFSVRTNDTSERACDANHLEREPERGEQQQQHPGEQSKRPALRVPPEMLLLLKVWLSFSPR